MLYPLIIALLASLIFPLAGTHLQHRYHNQLSDIYSLGLGSAACLGAALAPHLGIPIWMGALLFSITSNITSLICASLLSTKNLLTFGIIYGSLIGSFATIAATNLEPDALQSYYRWCSSTFDVQPSFITTTLTILLICIGLFCTVVGDFSLSIFGMQLACTSIIFQCGFIGMISLIIPNISRMLYDSYRINPYRSSILLGLLTVLPSFIITSLLKDSLYLPFSATYSILSAPFLLLTFKSNKR